MRVIVVNQTDFSDVAASFFVQQLLLKKNATIGLAGGTTTTPVHRAIVNQVKRLRLDVNRAKFFNVDEYFGASKNSSGSCFFRMNQQLFEPLQLHPNQVFCFNPQAENPNEECNRVLEAIDQNGGIDLQYLGLGMNGHVGFIQPGTPFHSSAYSFPFSNEFRKEKAAQFGGIDAVPFIGMTLGPKDCMHCRRIILVVNTSAKAGILKQVVEGPVTTSVPASMLQLHPDVFVVATQEAAGMLGCV